MAAFQARPCMISCVSASCLVCLFVAVSAASDSTALPSGYQVIHSKPGKRDLILTCVNKTNKPTKPTNKPTFVVTCPKRCQDECVGTCSLAIRCAVICDIPFFGMACGDPRFTGGDGNIFYFHGKKGEDFCLLSDAGLHINAHFIGKRNPEMNRDFTWVQALGILFGENHRLYFGVEKTMTWSSTHDRLVFTFDGQPIDIPTELYAKWVPASAPMLSITRTSDVNGIIVNLSGVFTIIAKAVPITKEDSDIHNYGVTTEDSLAHLDLSFKFHSLDDNVHGVLGQTYRPDYVNKLDVSKKMPLMGGTADYWSSSILSTDCAVARYHSQAEIEMVSEMMIA